MIIYLACKINTSSFDHNIESLKDNLRFINAFNANWLDYLKRAIYNPIRYLDIDVLHYAVSYSTNLGEEKIPGIRFPPKNFSPDLTNTLLIQLLQNNGCDLDVLRSMNLAEIILRHRNSLYNLGKMSANAQVLCASIHELFIRLAKAEILRQNVFAAWNNLIRYLQIMSGYELVEHFRLILLDRRQRFLRDEIMTTGTVDQSSVYVREVITKAIRYNVKDIIVYHNHPSGDCSPSQSDQDVTSELYNVCSLNGIRLIDHIIIGSNSYFSFNNASRMCK